MFRFIGVGTGSRDAPRTRRQDAYATWARLILEVLKHFDERGNLCAGENVVGLMRHALARSIYVFAGKANRETRTEG